MVIGHTPYSDATTGADRWSALIAIILDSSSFASAWRLPRRIGGFSHRPFEIMSCVLSRIVAQNRCDGLQHRGLSPRWAIIFPFGIGPFTRAHEIWCAFRFTPRPDVMRPYPNGWTAFAIHGQQSSSRPLETFGQNLCSKLARRSGSFMMFVNGVIADVYHTVAIHQGKIICL